MSSKTLPVLQADPLLNPLAVVVRDRDRLNRKRIGRRCESDTAVVVAAGVYAIVCAHRPFDALASSTVAYVALLAAVVGTGILCALLEEKWSLSVASIFRTI